MNETEKRQFLAHWERVRRRGIVLYLLTAALTWGTAFAVFFRFAEVLLMHDLHWSTLRAAYSSRSFLAFWGWCLLGGLGLGLALWLFYRWQYRRLQKKVGGLDG